MDGSAELFNQIGLVLTQLRFVRRAMEQIERSTARYTGITFATAALAGANFGQPPLLNGALKVYVTNLHELTPGTGFGGLLEGLLGGVGRFFGNFLGGFVGGTIGGVVLAFMVSSIERIVNSIDRILARIDAMRGPRSEGTPESSSSIDLNQVTQMINALQGLFTAASTGPDRAGAASNFPATETGQRWLVMLYAASVLVRSISYLVNGLIILIPVFVGALAALLRRFDDIKLRILDMLQFALRNVLLLRGVTLITIYDTVAGVAQLGAAVLRIAGEMLGRVISSLFRMLETLLSVAESVIRFVGAGLQNTMNALMTWLRTGLGTFISEIGASPLFRLLDRVVRMLPAILPHLVILIRGPEVYTGGGGTPPAVGLEEIRTAANDPAITGAGSGLGRGSTATPAPFPDISIHLMPPDQVVALRDEVGRAMTTFGADITGVFTAASDGFAQVGQTLNEQAAAAVGLFSGANAERLEELRRHATSLAGVLTPAVDAARRRGGTTEPPADGLERIAQAYETWLAGGGMRTLIGRIEQHFREAPTSGSEGELSILGRIVASQAGLAEATVEIDRLVIEVASAAAPGAGASASGGGEVSEVTLMSDHDVELLFDRLREVGNERILRGEVPDDPLSLG